MQYFWDTAGTIPAGIGFSLFSIGHICWLVSSAIVCLVLWRQYGRWGEGKRRRCRRVIAALLLTDEFFKDISTLCTGRFSPEFLPFHLCSINIFLILTDAISPRDGLREVLYAVCLPGAFFALITPGWSYLPLWNALCIHSFTAHILLFLYPLLVIREGFRPQIARLVKLLPCFIPAILLALLCNHFWGTNFMFLSFPGEGNILSWFADLWGTPGYLWGLPILCVLCWTVLYGGRALLFRYASRK